MSLPDPKNPLGLEGIDFVEITTPDPAALARTLRDLLGGSA